MVDFHAIRNLSGLNDLNSLNDLSGLNGFISSKHLLNMIIIIFHSQDLLSRDVLLMFPNLIGIIIICDCTMGVPWGVP